MGNRILIDSFAGNLHPRMSVIGNRASFIMNAHCAGAPTPSQPVLNQRGRAELEDPGREDLARLLVK